MRLFVVAPQASTPERTPNTKAFRNTGLSPDVEERHNETIPHHRSIRSIRGSRRHSRWAVPLYRCRSARGGIGRQHLAFPAGRAASCASPLDHGPPTTGHSGTDVVKLWAPAEILVPIFTTVLFTISVTDIAGTRMSGVGWRLSGCRRITSRGAHVRFSSLDVTFTAYLP
jgi:hypothetical protein